MHILDCLSPKRIYNKYLEEFVDVPCGKCPACLKSRANRWIERLNVERKCWKYCVFFTLTYAPENVPYLRKLYNGYYGDLSHKHQADGIDCPLFSLSDVYKNLDKDSIEKCNSFLSTFEKIPYLSVYDCQLFIKRLRKNIKNAVQKRFDSSPSGASPSGASPSGASSSEDYQVRYYLIGEYGGTTYRAHYHGLLFFSSEKEAACIEECISKSWTLGIVDASFVAESNAPYLAKYLNCTTDLPAVLTYCKQTRPFAIFSKSAPIGSLYYNEEKIQQIFDSASPLVLVDYLKNLSPQYVPLWRLHKDRLFPKLALFSRFSSFDRVRLYRTYEYFETNFPQVADSSAAFATYMLDRYKRLQTNACFGVYGKGFLKLYQDYLDELFKSFDNDCQRYNSLVRWYRCSSRVVHQARVFGITVERYVQQIEKFYSNCDYASLISQYQFMSDYAESFGSASLVGIDKGFLESVLDVPLELMSAEEITILESFGIDIEKFTSDNLSERLEYQSLILPENTRDFWNFKTDSLSWLKKATKTKKKNDYLMAHPELQNLL